MRKSFEYVCIHNSTLYRVPYHHKLPGHPTNNINNRPPLSTLLSSPSQCKGFTRVSEDSSETVFLLVENYNHDRSFCVFRSEWNFWKKKSKIFILCSFLDGGLRRRLDSCKGNDDVYVMAMYHM